nr:hypothetical protein [Tanacetum cinerariifolium]
PRWENDPGKLGAAPDRLRVVSTVEENWNNAVKSSACWIWRPKGNLIDHISKDNGSYTLKRFNYDNLQYALQDQGINNICSSKRAVEELEQENTKKQKVDDDQEETELKKCLKIIPDGEDDVTIDATPLSSMSPTIIDYNIHKEGRKSYFQIIRTDGSSQMYYTFSKMHKNFNREDLEVL